MKRLTAKEFMTISPQRQRWVILEAIRLVMAGLCGLAKPKRQQEGLDLFDCGVRAAATHELPGAATVAGRDEI